MFCPRCGTEVQTGAEFCTKCGAQITATATAVSRVTITNPYRGKNAQLVGAAIAILSVLVLCGVLANDQAPRFLGWIALFALTCGAVVYFAGKFAHWYHAE